MRWMFTESSSDGVAGLTEVDSMMTFDAHYSIELMDGVETTGSLLNIADERAPLAPVEAGMMLIHIILLGECSS